MDRATTRYSWLVRAAGSTPRATLSPNATNANSPPGASSRPARVEAILDRPNMGPAASITPTLPTMSTTMAASTVCHFSRKSLAFISMPTDMKNRPSSRPLYGAMSDSTCSAYSVSAMSRPARNAPSASDSPASDVSTEVDSTTASVVAAKISAFANDDIFLYSGWMNSLPPAMIPTMHTTALTAASPSALAILAMPPDDPSGAGASRGMSISSTTTARSCSSSTEKVARPWRDPISPRSSSTWMATAVEDMASDPPRMMALGPLRPVSATAAAATATSDSATCAVPMPNTYLAIDCSRSSDSSRPMLNSRNTTPSSARCFTDCTSWMRPSAWGPTMAPPSR
mmetsp:Transcript_14056/g.34679  ORF Transcript_14056/g.34679 Transcript_14056/m.34679 type:complete len:342 (+) Transcript_14056:747-1772(+)